MRREFEVYRFNKGRTFMGIIRITGGNTWFTNWEFVNYRGDRYVHSANTDEANVMHAFRTLIKLYGVFAAEWRLTDVETKEDFWYEDAVEEDWREREEYEE